MNTNRRGIILAVLSAFFMALNFPVSKLLLQKLPPVLSPGVSYLSAGFVISLIYFFNRKNKKKNSKDEKITDKDIIYIVAMIIIDVLATVLFMVGIKRTTAANASLLSDFEVVAASLVALIFFKEIISARLWTGVIFVTVSSMLLTIENPSGLSFSAGSIFVLLSACLYGTENNITKKLAKKNPMLIIIIKEFGCGTACMVISLAIGERTNEWLYLVYAMIIGLFSYGLNSILFLMSQRELGATKSSTLLGTAPFIGTLLSLIVFQEIPGISLLMSAILMAIGTFYASSDDHKKKYYYLKNSGCILINYKVRR